METVALLSGGKDSCFNMMHCVSNGHRITSLANLHPPASEVDEMDSWMFQTVGHDVVDLYSGAMNLPLFRQAIRGRNVQQGLHYSQALGDETEDLYELLKRVVDELPNTKAVSVGAIASNYQRLRVENVAARLNLTVLAYLWERDQSELLREMIDNGLHAILIKVASYGLSAKHLGQSLSEIEPLMTTLKDRFQVHPCGEGGEYESLVLDCPLFVRKLVITDTQVVKLEGATAYLKVKAVLCDKEAYEEDWQKNLQIAGNLMPTFDSVLDMLRDHKPTNAGDESDFCSMSMRTSETQLGLKDPTSGTLRLSRYVQTHEAAPLLSLTHDCNDDILFCFLILQDMRDFAAVNADYARLWSAAHPPARVCISSPLPWNVKYILITVSRTAMSASGDAEDAVSRETRRQWVQSRSYWAPSNIGPYSQLALSDGLYFTSGQIGLVPATMQLAVTVEEEIVWSMQSLHRVNLLHSVQDFDGVLLCFVLSETWISHVHLAYEQLKDEMFSGDVSLLVLQLCQGSQLPRAASVEWQFIANRSSAITKVSTNRGSQSGTCELSFSASSRESLGEQCSALQVQSIMLNGVHESYAAVSFSED